MRATIFVLILTMTAAAAERRPLHRYRREVLSGRAVGTSATGATIQHLRNRPREWGAGPGGFGKRFASNLGQHVVKGTIEMGVGALHH